jgi:hypothetical protein
MSLLVSLIGAGGGGGGLTSPVGIADGGTGQTAQTAAMDALSPSTTKGDILVDDGTNVIRLAVGSNDQVLTADSGEASGTKWAAASGGDPTHVRAPIAQTDISSQGIPLIQGTSDVAVSSAVGTYYNKGYCLWYPAYVSTTQTYNDICLDVSVAGTAGNAMEIILYNVGADGMPSTKAVESGSIAVDATGVASAAIDTSITKGAYWVCLLSDNGNVDDGSIYAHANAGGYIRSFVHAVAVESNYAGFWKFGSYTIGNAPTSPTGVSLDFTGQPPFIWLEVD